MKEGIHPEYKATTILCACGAEIKTRYGNASSATLTAAPDPKKAAAPAPAKKAAASDNRAAKRAKATAGKPKKVEAAVEAPAAEPKAE